MKANELQIGDWVQIVEPCKYAGAIGRVKTLIDHKDDENAYFKVFLRNNTIHIGIEDICSDDIRPIPLTPEILKKNGHKVPGYSVWDLEADGAEVQWVRETMDTINPPMQYRLAPRQKNVGVQETLICHIKYVHELQHALRLCGIEKTIKL